MCVALSGCEAASVGIIGGADGPTAVYVTDGEEKEVEKTKANVQILKVSCITIRGKLPMPHAAVCLTAVLKGRQRTLKFRKKRRNQF